jgi:hypothetical protein
VQPSSGAPARWTGPREMEVQPGMGAHGVGGSMKPGWAELEGLLRTIDKSSNRLDSLDSIREVVKANGCLPDAPLRSRLVRAASLCVSDPNSRIASKWLQVSRAPPPPPMKGPCAWVPVHCGGQRRRSRLVVLVLTRRAWLAHACAHRAHAVQLLRMRSRGDGQCAKRCAAFSVSCDLGRCRT